MAVLSDYVSGTITLTNGSVDFTGSATGWLLAAFKEGDTIIDITGATEFMGVIAEITSNTAGKLTKAWEGPNLVDAPYRMRYQADGSRVSAQARNLIELLGDGTLTSLAGLSGPGVIELLPGGGAQVVPKTDLVSGANYDVQVSDLAGRAVYDGQAEGFSVLVADVGDGRSAIYSKASNASADWTDPAYVTGPIGETPEVAVGTVTTGAPGTDAEVTATPITGGVELDFTIPAGEGFISRGAYSGATAYAKGDVVRDAGSSWIALQATTGNAPPTLPTTSNAYWELLAQKGQDGTGTGDVVGPAVATNNRVVVFDGATGKQVKDSGSLIQSSQTDATAGSLLTVGAFGVGKTVSLVSPDLNSVRPSGRYYCNSPTNGPGGNGWLDVFDLDADYAYHEFTNLSGVVFSRIRSGGVWSIWQPHSEMYLHVREEQAQNTAGGAAASGANDRVLNAVKFNNIPGASVATNRITLPEGVYKVEIKSPAYAVDAFKVALLEYPSLTLLMDGINAFSWSSTPSAVTYGEVTGILTIPSGGKTMLVRLYAGLAKGINGLGVQVNRSGLVEVYTDVMIKRIK